MHGHYHIKDWSAASVQPLAQVSSHADMKVCVDSTGSQVTVQLPLSGSPNLDEPLEEAGYQAGD